MVPARSVNCWNDILDQGRRKGSRAEDITAQRSRNQNRARHPRARPYSREMNGYFRPCAALQYFPRTTTSTRTRILAKKQEIRRSSLLASAWKVAGLR
jgi:hypothetical protein